MAQKWFECRLLKVRSLTENTRQFDFGVDELDRFDFVPGQFITMDLPIGEKRQERWRSYSISSAPSNENTFELCIVRAKDGGATSYLFDTLKVGEVVKFKGPSGSFILPNNAEGIDLVMICTGTGLAPFKAMIDDMMLRQQYPKSLHLIFGTRHESEILYRSHFEEMSRQFEWFTYDVALSRDAHWSGYKGYVHQIYESMPLNAAAKYLICGWSQMIDETVVRLENLGIKKENILYELYG